VSKPSDAGKFLQYGTMHEAIGNRKSEGRVTIASLIEKPHFFGVGALARLKGEVTVFDSEATISNVGPDGQVKAAEIANAQATMLAGAYVPEWDRTTLDSSLEHKALEARIEQLASQSGLNESRPIAFTIKGEMDEVTFHVINGACPVHASRNKIAIDADKQPVHTTLNSIKARLVGIFAKDAAGQLTHPGTQLHLHIVYEDDHGIRQTGHVEKVTVGKQSVISLPRMDSEI
jgi:alpha-acetolactate decarboxylase